MIDINKLYQALPHSDDMCLIQNIIDWSESTICCSTTAHLDADNILAIDSRLPAWSGIEYIAQALALHGVLLKGAEEQLVIQKAFVATIQTAEIFTDDISQYPGALTIQATIIFSQENSAVFDCSLEYDGEELLSCECGVIFQ